MPHHSAKRRGRDEMMERLLFFYPAASEYRTLFIDQDDDGTWSYEWKSRSEAVGFLTRDAAYTSGLAAGQQIYPGIVPAKGDENAYAAEWREDKSDV